MNRMQKLNEIYKVTEQYNLNRATMIFLLASMTDKALTKFHKELLEKKPLKNK